MKTNRAGRTSDSRNAHAIAQDRAAADKRALIMRALTRDGTPLPPPPPPPVPILNTDEAQAEQFLQEMDATRAQRRANALAAIAEDDYRLARWQGRTPAPIPFST